MGVVCNFQSMHAKPSKRACMEASEVNMKVLWAVQPPCNAHANPFSKGFACKPWWVYTAPMQAPFSEGFACNPIQTNSNIWDLHASCGGCIQPQATSMQTLFSKRFSCKPQGLFATNMQALFEIGLHETPMQAIFQMGLHTIPGVVHNCMQCPLKPLFKGCCLEPHASPFRGVCM